MAQRRRGGRRNGAERVITRSANYHRMTRRRLPSSKRFSDWRVSGKILGRPTPKRMVRLTWTPQGAIMIRCIPIDGSAPFEVENDSWTSYIDPAWGHCDERIARIANSSGSVVPVNGNSCRIESWRERAERRRATPPRIQRVALMVAEPRKRHQAVAMARHPAARPRVLASQGVFQRVQPTISVSIWRAPLSLHVARLGQISAPVSHRRRLCPIHISRGHS